MKSLYTVTAVLEVGAGLGLIGVPSLAANLLLGTSLTDPAALTVARIGGGGLLALGVACWLARADVQSRTVRGLIAGLLIYNVVAAAMLAVAGIAYRLFGVALWPGVVLHVVMGVWCVVSLVGGKKT